MINGLAQPGFSSLNGYPSVPPVYIRVVRKRKVAFPRKGGLGVTFCGFFKAEWDGNGKSECTCRHSGKVVVTFYGNASRYYVPTQLPKRLLKRTSFEATSHEELTCLNQIRTCFLFALS